MAIRLHQWCFLTGREKRQALIDWFGDSEFHQKVPFAVAGKHFLPGVALGGGTAPR